MQRFFLVFIFIISCGLCSKQLNSVRLSSFLKLNYCPHLKRNFVKGVSTHYNIKCTTDEECKSFIDNSICDNLSCKCPPGKLLTSDGSKCVEPVKEFGDSCEDNVQCSQLLSSGGACIDNKCKCKTGYHYLKKFCWKNYGLHQECHRNEQCFSDYEYIGFECIDKVCKCRSNYYQRLNSGCRLKRKINESCNLDTDCVDKNATCERTCVSFTTQKKVKSSKEGTMIEKAKKNLNSLRSVLGARDNTFIELGMECDEDSECSHISNALCLHHMCACQPVTHIASEDNKKCLKVVRGKVDNITKTPCKENEECGVFGENSFCNNKKCACKTGSYWEVTNKYCWAVKSVGESCSDDKDCHPSVNHAVCKETKTNKQKVCTCDEGFHLKSENNTCLPDAVNVGDYCEDDNECLFPNSYCDTDTNECTCKEHYYVENKKCISGVECPCNSDADCSHLKNTKCSVGNSRGKQCLCLENHIKSENNMYCLPGVQYNEECTESFQCKSDSGELSECRDGICQCNKTAHYTQGKCYKSKFVKDSCSLKPECFPGNDTDSVICLKGFCACNYEYILDENRICVKENSATTMNFHTILVISLGFFIALS